MANVAGQPIPYDKQDLKQTDSPPNDNIQDGNFLFYLEADPSPLFKIRL